MRRVGAAALALALVLGACGDTGIGPPPAPQGPCACPRQATVLAERPAGSPIWPDRWETVFSGVGFLNRGPLDPGAGVDPAPVYDELLDWLLSSGFELLGSSGPGLTELFHENDRVSVTLAAAEQELGVRVEVAVERRYGWDLSRWSEEMREGTTEVAELEARRDADAAALLAEVLRGE